MKIHIEGCFRTKNNGIEGSVSEYEAHACCNVGWMSVDLESAIERYGKLNKDSLWNI